MRSRVLVLGSKVSDDTFANSPFGLIIEATQALQTPWTLAPDGPWVGPRWAWHGSSLLRGPWASGGPQVITNRCQAQPLRPHQYISLGRNLD